MTLRRVLIFTVAAALSVSGGLLVAAPAAAADRVVDSTADDNSPGTLRYEIENADDGDVIVFDETVFGSAQTIVLDGTANGPIEIPTSIDIVGPGSGLLTVTRGDDPTNYNIFEVVPGVDQTSLVVALRGMTITSGDTNAQGSAFQSLSPEVVQLTFSDVVISMQTAQHGGGVYVESLQGNLSFYDSSFSNNHALGSGGAIATLGVGGTVLIWNTGFLENAAEEGAGGAVAVNHADLDTASLGSVYINEGSDFNQNVAETMGGAVYVNDVSGLLVTDATFTVNSAGGTGGALYASNLTGSMLVGGVTFEQNDAEHGGALRFDGVQDVLIDDTLFSNNDADSGGAIGLGMVAGSYGEVTIQDSRFVGNFTLDGFGGAIFTDGSGEAPFTILRTSFEDNWVSTEAGVARGGAIYVDSVYHQFTIDSSTFTGNALHGDPTALQGISVYVDYVNPSNESSLLIVNSTFDEALDGSDGTYVVAVNFNEGSVAIAYSTIVGHIPLAVGTSTPQEQYVVSTIMQANPSQVDIYAPQGPVGVEYSVLSRPFDPVYVDDLGNNQFATDAQLGPLQNNGGPTETRMPAVTSPAVGHGGPVAGAPEFDQRGEGFPRIVGTLDVGAVEVPEILPVTGSSVPLWVPIVGAIVLLLGAGAVVFTIVSRRRLGSDSEPE